MKTLLFRNGFGHHRKAVRLSLLAMVLLGGWLYPFALRAASTITFVQGNYATPQTPQTTVSVTFTAAQVAGDLNVVAVGWNDSTATVSAVTDRSGNTYTRAVGPTVQAGIASQSIYYAKNIVSAAAGVNIVTVTFSTAAAFPDIRILEYSGADLVNPVDVTAASSGTSAASSSGTATTTNATDLIFGANLVQTLTTGAGASFTSRLLTNPDGDIAEDRMVTATGSYNATAPLSSGQWIMQMVAFRTPTGTLPPTVSSVSPNSGSTAGGAAVTITGTNFAAGATVAFGVAAATNVVVVNNTTITATTPASSAGAVTVTVTNPGGQAGSLTNGFTYTIPPTVTSVSPNTGSTTGGTAVTITGTNFAAGATVTFGGTAATNVAVVSSTTITARTPAGSAGAVTVAVTVSGQSGSLTNGFTYVVVPTVTSVSPNNGPTAGGTAVTITGTNFAAGAAVTFGGTAATNVAVVNSTTITATTPAGSAGAVTVIVTVNGQSGSLANGFTYIASPTVTSVSPNSGSTAGGTAATITGTNFAAGATVTFGGTAATNVAVVNSTTITARTPAGSAGTVTVTVTVSGQSGNLTSGFAYVVVPTVTSVSPNNGPTAGGTAVTITGTNFAAGATVTFAGAAATNVVVVNGTTITATTPAGSAGAVTVAVTANGQNGSLTNGFTYIVPPTVTSVSPSNGSTTGGTAVTITGTNFAAGATVTFGGTAATNVVIVNSTTITATTPAGAAGAVTVTVTNPGSQSGSLTNGYTYVLVPTVTSVSPNNGPTAGGTAVTITGTNFAAGAGVTFGGTAATNVAVVNSTTITATTPAGNAGAATVTVTVNSQSGSLTNGFTYIAPPTVTSVSPNSGSTAGGTAVTITGANFAAGATVTFGGTAATNVAVVNSTTITATTPAGSAAAVTVTVTVSGQSGNLTNGFTYIVPPTVTSVSPNSGSTAGGTAVTITGTNFAAGAGATFGGAAATNVVVVNSTTITATTPAGSAGAVTVTVTVSGQSGSLTNGFTYVVVPTVTSVSPNNGPTAGGTAVTIAGTNFAAGATVTFGGTAATNVAVVNSTTITATTPAGSNGAVTVTVTNPSSQSGSLTNGYTYSVVPTPTAPTGLTAAGGGPGPIVAAVQSYINTTSLTSHTTAAFDSTGGDLIVMLASSHMGVTLTPSDSFANTWTSIAGPTSTTVGFDLRTQAWYARNPIVGPGHTVTIGLSIAQPLVISIIVVKGSNISSPIDAVSLISSDNGTQTVNVASPSVSTTSTNDLLIAFAKVSAGAVFQAGTGFTQQAAASSNFLDAETGPAALSSTYNATFTLNQAQTWQSAVVAAANNPNQATLSWTASTETGGTISQYLVERCQGASCNSFAQIGTTTGTSYNDSGLTASTSYSYRVRAQDTANTVGPYSNVATFTTPAPIPAAPGNVTAIAASAKGINLTWTASTETGGTISSYLIERCQGVGCSTFAQIGTSVGTTFNDTGLTASTSYSYRVRAMDAASNLSPYSNLAGATTLAQGNTITYVQGNYATPQSSQTTVNITFNAAQIAGDLNVVVVGWNNSTATVSAVTDKGGNTYTRAVGPTIISGVESQSIYYAKNIAAAAAGANTVTVTFSTAAAFPDIRILEYNGADTNNPVDVTAASSGNSATSSSGSAATTNATDLLFGANLVQTLTTGPGAGFTSRLLTNPDGDIAEDHMVTATGSYTATAPVSPSGQWIMQLAAFRAASGGSITPPTAPTNLVATAASAGQINLTWTASTSSVGIANYIVQRCQGAGCTNFAQLAAPTGITYSDIGLTASTSYSYQVQAVDTAGNASALSNVASTTTTGGFTISPRTATLTSTLTQQFTASSGGVSWSVDGALGGSASTGTITATGLYTPPAAVGVHTVTASISSSQVANASVYITNYPGTFTRDIDKLRTGLNPNETVLTPANVNVAQFGKLSSYPIDGTADASPLYVAGVNIPGSGSHNVVYVATEHDSVYAFDADGRQNTPLWKVSFINPANGITTVPPSDTGECCDISPEIGITGSPVIESTTNTLYVVVKTKEVSGSTNYFHRLHALDLGTGAEKFGGPIVIQASVPGTGAGSSGGQVSFMSLHENQRAALLLNNGVVYIAFGAHGDNSPYHGWVLGYNASTLQQIMVYNASPNDPGIRSTGGGQGSGVWQSGDGLATDSTGSIYFVTGNGLFDVNTGGVDYGDSFLKLGTTGIVQDFFTPHDQQFMNDNDIDLGSGGVLLLPDSAGSSSHPHLAITAGKNGTIYLIDRDNLGHYNPNNDSQIVQSVVNTFPNGTKNIGNFKAPVYWNGHLFFSADADFIKSFSMTNGLISTAPTSQSSFIPHYPGATLELSSNGTTNGVLWAIQRVDLDPTGGGTRGPGSLHAFDATNLATELYNSNQASGSRDMLDFTCKWSAPLVANGKVFVASETQLTVFGLLP